MGGLGQSSDPQRPVLRPRRACRSCPGLIEVITKESSAPGERHAAARRPRGRDRRSAPGGAIPEDPTTEASGRRLDPGRRLGPYQLPHLRHARLPRLHLRPQHVQPRGGRGADRLHRQPVLPGRPGGSVPAGLAQVRAGPDDGRAAAVGDVLRRGRPGGPVAALRRHPHPRRRLQRQAARLAVRAGRVGALRKVLRGHRMSSSAGHDRRWHARLRVHGQGALARPSRPSASSTRRSCRTSSRSPAATAARSRTVAARFGWEEAMTDWREQVADERDRAVRQRRPERAARRAVDRGARGREARALREAARTSTRRRRTHVARGRGGGRRAHACGFNYRFVPAVRRRARSSRPATSATIVHFRARYLQSWGWDADTEHLALRPRAGRGTGAIGDLGAHIIDLARFLVGEIESVSRVGPHLRAGARGRRRVRRVDRVRGRRDRHARGDAARAGRINQPTFEINGSEGSSRFDLRALRRAAGAPSAGTSASARSDSLRRLTGGRPATSIGWGDTFTLEYAHLFDAIAGEDDGRTVRRDIRGRLSRRRGL